MEYILLDRSIFHQEKFDRICGSPMARLVKGMKIRVYYTPTFIEETLQFGFKHRERLKGQLDFLISINSTHWFRAAEAIVEAELAVKFDHPRYYLLTDEEIGRITAGVGSFFRDQINEHDLKDVLKEVQEINDNREQFRKHRLELRSEVPSGDYDFERQFEHNAEWMIREGFGKSGAESDQYFKRWQTSRELCPFTDQYLRARLATMFLPVTKHTLAVGKNDPADATLLAYLIWGDIVVSDDTRFFKEAFNLLYKDKKQRLFTLDELMEYMEALNDSL